MNAATAALLLALLLLPAASAALPLPAAAPAARAAALLAAAESTVDPLRAGLAVASSAAGLAVPQVPRGSLDGAEAWLLAHGVAPAQSREARAAVAALPPGPRVALLDTLQAFAAFEAAARIAPTQVDSERLALLAASVALRDALAAEAAPLHLQLPPALALDLAGVPDTYVADFALSIDAGGDDLYLNAAGGTSPGGSCPIGGTVTRPASAALDLAGHDRYVSGRRCGVNGGGWFGAGFLLDAAGDDAYAGNTNAVNGGAVAGSGFLLDARGRDSYQGEAVAVNGGGVLAGRGALLDLAGADGYAGGAVGVNGGGSTNGLGLLLDLDGHDAYRATQIGVNGGGWLGGQGALIDAAGDDTYAAGVLAVNGGGGGAEYGQPGVGLLLDAGGRDRYDDLEGGSGDDATVVPKGLVGAQLDL